MAMHPRAPARSMSMAARWLYTLGALTLARCDSSPGNPTGTPTTDSGAVAPGGDGGSPGGPVDASATSPGAALYATLCASCHGEVGEGGRGPRLMDWSRGYDALVGVLGHTMPKGNPASCGGTCPDQVASYILSQLTSANQSCASVGPSARRLRLLTRREYRNTVRDLLGIATGAAPAPGCNHRSFRYVPVGRTVHTVNLAGDFNAWSADSWPLTYSASAGAWVTDRDIPDGRHLYKFVLDGTTWVADPTDPDTAPDGFGGSNSVLTVTCTPGGMAAAIDPAATLPAESRPPGFLFDDNADTGVVTPTHITEYLRAAQTVVTAVGTGITGLVPCDYTANARGCADTFARTFGRRAFRRPLTDTEAARYTGLITAQSDVATGLARAVRAFLLSPNFLYRSEMGVPQADGTYRLTGYETAAALSYQFWATTPDDTLLAAAGAGTLDTPAGIEQQARRLLADPRARDPISEFAVQWLGVGPITEATRSPMLYPGWNPALATAMLEETRRFAAHVVFDGTHRMGELFTAPYGFVNSTLAGLYGLPGVSTTDYQMLTYPDGTRAGVLGQGAVMTRYAHSDQSSPILRGVFVRVNLLCQEFPPPPANAGGVPDVDPHATTRARFAQHTANPACSACHNDIDPVGFGFENLDAVGAVRATENGQPIDHTGVLTDVEGFGTGTTASFATLADLGSVLAGSTAARTCFVRQYYRFARGFRETAADRCAIHAIADRVHAANDDVRELAVAVALSPDYVRRR